MTDFVIYVDVDDTLVRSVGTKRIPMPGTIAHIRELHAQGAQMFCWSSGGAAYARQSAAELGIEECFIGFLPKPNLLLDDQEIGAWRGLKCVHPAACAGRTLDDYKRAALSA